MAVSGIEPTIPEDGGGEFGKFLSVHGLPLANLNRPSAVAAREQDLVLGREMPAQPAVAASRPTPAYAEPDDGTAPTGERPLGEESGSVVPAARAARANLFGAVARDRPIACGMLFRVLPCLLGLGLVSAWGRETTAMADACGRADFVCNVVKYVDWPASAFSGPKAPIVIGVVGDDGLAETLRRVAVGRGVAGRALAIEVISPDEDPRGCHLIFIGDDFQQHAAGLLKKIADAPVLTVGEGEDFLAGGGMVCLVRCEHKLRSRVVLPALARVGIKVSSKLLAVSEVLRSGPK